MRELFLGIALGLGISFLTLFYHEEPQTFLSPLPDAPVQEKVDPKVENLKRFFAKYRSPLYDYSRFIVDISRTYGLDYRLLPAIAGTESTFCKFTPIDSHNCWGWGIYGSTVTRFPNYKLAIQEVARGLYGDRYRDKSIEGIAEIYTARP